MTPPRQITADTTFDITLRTHGRSFRLLPTREINNLFLYLLGLAAARHRITLYGVVVMATHVHLQGKDCDGRLPDFTCYFHSLLARALNALQGLDDKVWSGDGYNLVRPQAPHDLLSRLVYAAANPAAAGLVQRATDYPGVVTCPRDIGKTFTATRPGFFFRESMPATSSLRFEVPDDFAHLGRDGFVELFEEQLRERERQHREERRVAGRTVLGAKRCKRAALGQRSSSYEEWFQLRPAIAAKLKADRMAAIHALRSFRDRYRVALVAWRDGKRDVLFPVGTWWMCQFAGAAVG